MTAANDRPRWSPIPIAATALGALLCIIGLIVDPRRLAAAYLVAYLAILAIALGTLAMVMIARLTAATWFVVLRRQAEQVIATIPVLGVLFIPVLVAARWLYPWVNPLDNPPLESVVHEKGAYLNVPFFLFRAAVYWAIWIGLSVVLRRTSLEQDSTDSPGLERRLRLASGIGIVAFGLSITFASFDWMMSLAPAWYSTVYGVDYFAGAMVGALALLAVLLARAVRHGELPTSAGPDHMHALAKLLLTFVLFWVYIGFSQFIVIWSAEIPVESGWYVIRTRGGWATLGTVLVLGHFALPFCALLVRAVKRSILAMAGLGCWLLVMHYLDCYWIVMPDALRRADSGGFGYVLDLGALLLVAGSTSVIWRWRRSGEPAVPRNDPELAASFEYSIDRTL